MPETFAPYDAAEYLDTEENIQAYVEAAVEAAKEDQDPKLITMALAAVARARNMSQIARDTGMTREGLYKALSPNGNPSLATVMKIASVLGFSIKFAMQQPSDVEALGNAVPEKT